MTDAYVLTDARGTTTVVAHPSHIFLEAGRLVLLAPIHVDVFRRTVDDWARVGDWVRVGDYIWPEGALRA